ncbi:MAG: DUF2993 domain-containing protein [Cyanobacteria bacterium J06648_1]
MVKSSDIGEQAISKAAELGIKSQLDESESLDVNIRSHPLDLVQGNIESVSVEGRGLVMQQDLRADKLRIETNSISIDSLKAVMGDIELNQPTDARMLVVLKEEDIQRAFNSEFVQKKLQSLTINYEGEKVNAKIEQVKFLLPEADKVKFDADVFLIELNRQEKICFTAIPKVNDAGSCVVLQSVKYQQDSQYNDDVGQAIIDSAEQILDIRNFKLSAMSFKVRKLDVKAGTLTIEADAEIREFPDAD